MITPKICFIITDAISFNTLCSDQLHYFKAHSDLDITLICGGNESDLDILVKSNIGKVVDADLKRQPSIFSDIKSLLFLIKYLSRNRFNIIVYSTPKALLLGSIASCITFQKRRIALIRGRAYENFTGKKRFFYKSLDKIALYASHEVVFISESLKQAYAADNIVSDKKTVILGSGSSNGVNTLTFKPSIDQKESSKTSSLKEKDKSFNVLVIGRICQDKGIYDLAEVIENIQNLNVKFKLVGRIEDDASKDFLEDLLKRFPQVEHIPHTDNVAQYFKSSDLHLFLSHREGFGNVAIEAASCGVPTFAYDVVGVKDSVLNNISGQRFKFKDNKSIAHAIDDAASDPIFSKKYSSARDWVVNNFEQTKVWKSYLKFYLKSL